MPWPWSCHWSSFNPRPSRRKGATQAHACRFLRIESFNPRPSRRKGATSAVDPYYTVQEGFNPRPSRRKGATIHGWRDAHGTAVSILALPEGRALPCACDGKNHGTGVSILALPEGRALRRKAIRTARAPTCFNPRPSRRKGATLRCRRADLRLIVSILALPEGRALPIRL